MTDESFLGKLNLFAETKADTFLAANMDDKINGEQDEADSPVPSPSTV